MQIDFKTKKIQLDHRAIEYVRNRLEHGKNLSELILKYVDLEQGSVTTVLPQNVTVEEAHEFKISGKTPEAPEHLWKRGRNYVSIPVVSIEFFVSDIIYEHLSADDSMICLIEDYLASATDPGTLNGEDRELIYKDDVYTLFMRDTFDTENPPEGCYSDGIVILSSISSETDLTSTTKTQFTIDELTYIAKHTRKIAIDAYDRESYLVWERNK